MKKILFHYLRLKAKVTMQTPKKFVLFRSFTFDKSETRCLAIEMARGIKLIFFYLDNDKFSRTQ